MISFIQRFAQVVVRLGTTMWKEINTDFPPSMSTLMHSKWLTETIKMNQWQRPGKNQIPVLSSPCFASRHISGRIVFVLFPQWFQIGKLLIKYHTSIWILTRTIKENHLTAPLLTTNLIQDGHLATSRAEAGNEFQIWGGGRLPQKLGGRKLVSQQLKLVGTHRGALKDLHFAAKTLFTYLKHLSHLEKERQSGRPVPFNPVSFATFLSSQDSAQHAWRLGRQDFLLVAFSSLFNASRIHLFPLLFWDWDVAGRKCCFGQILINMFKTRHCYRRFSIRVTVSLKYRIPIETFPKITTRLGNHSSSTNLISHCGISH